LPFALILLASIVLPGEPVCAQFTMPELSHTLTRLREPVAAKNFRLDDLDGKPHALSDYRGKVLVINFWATWCPPCRREMPALERLYQKLHDEPFAVVAIDQWEDPDQVFPYLGQLGTFPTFPILFDRKSEVAQAFGVKGLPTSFILDKAGRIVYRAIGGREFDYPEIEQTIRALLR
jgi:thiol-disulfide isomerase/thioredoxin